MLALLLHGDSPLLVLAAFILEPHSYHPRTEAGHLDQLLLHKGIRSWIGGVAVAQRMQLFLVQHRSHPRRLAVGRDFRTAAPAHLAVAVFIGP